MGAPSRDLSIFRLEDTRFVKVVTFLDSSGQWAQALPSRRAPPHASKPPRPSPARPSAFSPASPPAAPASRSHLLSFSTSLSSLAHARLPRLCACHDSLPLAQPAPHVQPAPQHQHHASTSPLRTLHAPPAPLQLSPTSRCAVCHAAQDLLEAPLKSSARLGRSPSLYKLNTKHDSEESVQVLERSVVVHGGEGSLGCTGGSSP